MSLPCGTETRAQMTHHGHAMDDLEQLFAASRLDAQDVSPYGMASTGRDINSGVELTKSA